MFRILSHFSFGTGKKEKVLDTLGLNAESSETIIILDEIENSKVHPITYCIPAVWDLLLLLHLLVLLRTLSS